MAKTKNETEKPFAPTEDSPEKISEANKSKVANERRFIQELKKEPKVGVLGTSVYAQYLGRTYTFTYNGLPVSINFDDQVYYYPKTIAEALQKKLTKISRAITPKKIETKL